jgi:hypothetical protein
MTEQLEERLAPGDRVVCLRDWRDRVTRLRDWNHKDLIYGTVISILDTEGKTTIAPRRLVIVLWDDGYLIEAGEDALKKA